MTYQITSKVQIHSKNHENTKYDMENFVKHYFDCQTIEFQYGILF